MKLLFIRHAIAMEREEFAPLGRTFGTSIFLRGMTHKFLRHPTQKDTGTKKYLDQPKRPVM